MVELRRVLAKILFCNEYDLDNVLLHLPVGVFLFLLSMYVSGFVGIAFAYAFVRYELKESKILLDKGYPEIQGLLWGLGLASVIWRLITWLMI